ncbi:ferritin-like domain-containing protein [Mameliella sediminis]|uniref:ferritin-like domain-containing protein n=1 Tax=Mameliella sediminis TaxID=2836866 RepID=UPI001C467217|nr:ferritin-like domain-containing protein [Mameliella sediminis]MBY6116372.1 ferritin-like domain-containing protein [Antarctobacter heliothermus]MBY6145602.1 ferritin-like domain-containing protein [Mameliella alba]MBV7393674.1 ferritin-like domain-containing protein [Mameliella sediminis]MBY6160926.1 ferritin-like domain-containing protein [Mameliella alba]MBY6169396.1 ferritin-like domain-containing protein [Mameliella alba]
MMSLCEMAVDVLTTADGRQKTAKSRAYAAQWFAAQEAGTPIPLGVAQPPLRPARPAQPELLDPRDVPKRKPGSPQGRIALLHAVAHIELNAVDLHWDIIPRFAETPMPVGFYDDWVKAADEESKHFNLICDCLEELGSYYGALPAHAGMWRAAEDTVGDFMGRLAVVPMVLEARGLDVTPGMIEIFRKAGADSAVAALEVIYSEEVSHVAYGSKWFHFLCGRHDTDPKLVFHKLVRRYFKGALKPPFNEEKRAEAGLPPDFYWPLAEETPQRSR